MTAIRALGLLSGGLDSTLAARLLIDQGIEVVGLHLTAPTACRTGVADVARHLGIRLIEREKGEGFLRLLRAPRWGYGRNMNPCVDCRVFMFGIARGVLEETGARFIFTGEVAGQRPMSQGTRSMELIDKESGLASRVLRPLSARLLRETEPERLGWVDRSRLLAISGRGRSRQLALAARYGLEHYGSPAGGCLLTDPGFSRKLRDLFEHVPADETREADVELLRLGRHVRVDGRTKVVLGRHGDENRRLAAFEGDGRWRIEPVDFDGPTALVCGPRSEQALEAAIALIARYVNDASPGHRVRWREQGVEHRRRLGPAAVERRAEVGRDGTLPVLQPGAC